MILISNYFILKFLVLSVLFNEDEEHQKQKSASTATSFSSFNITDGYATLPIVPHDQPTNTGIPDWGYNFDLLVT